MANQSVIINKVDKLGSAAAAATDRIVAILAPAKSGTFNQPTALTRSTDMVTAFGGGPLVHIGAIVAERTKLPVLLIRTDAAASTYSALAETAAGTAVPTAGATPPDDDYDVVIEVITGGVRGTAGITYRYTLDGGVTYSGEIALGTATSFVLDGNVTVLLAAGNLTTGNKISFRTSAGVPSPAHLTAALESLRVTKLPWSTLLVVTPATSLIAAQVEAWLVALEGAGVFKKAVLGARRRNVGETRAAFATAMQTLMGVFSTIRGGIAADAADMRSPIDERWYPRSPSVDYVCRDAVGDVSDDVSAPVLGSSPGVSIFDASLNPKHHDEYLYPGLDDLKFITMRSYPDRAGAFLSNPRVFSPTGSDYRWLQNVNVINLAASVAQQVLTLRLSVGVETDTDTGFIAEEDALEIEELVNKQLERALVNNRRASAAKFIVSRIDDILSTDTVNGDVEVQFKGYPKKFIIRIGARRPAGA